MQALRTSTTLRRLILAWFVAFVGVASASPLVAPGAFAVICSADGGTKAIALDDGGSDPGAATHPLKCPLCLPTGLAPADPGLQVDPPHPLAHALHAARAAHLAARVGAPLPARGPPAQA